MIVTKTYINKSNTIIKDNAANLSLNPILELNYGDNISRGLLYFDHTKLKKMVRDKTYPDINKLHHVLKMTNCASITSKHINDSCFTVVDNTNKQRAISFDLIFFLIPNEWDNGRGFDYICDLYNGKHRGISTDASNWYQYKNYLKWNNEGIYTIDELFKDYDLFSSKYKEKAKIIIAKQHFDYGNENVEIDITDTVNKFITEELPNYGIGIAFAPYYENQNIQNTQYVGFFTQHTNSFYEPYIETRYDEYIEDDRTNFYLDKNNKLYFYSVINGNFKNLDELPKCHFNDEELIVKQATKGIYYVDITLSSNEYEEDTMLYDIWSNIKYKNKEFKPVELNFVTKLSSDYFSFGLPSLKEENNEIIPSVYGICENETIKQGDIRKINVDCKIPYSSNKQYSVDNISYRLYIKEDDKQIDVIDWTCVERGYNENYFYINTNDLIPFRYFIDIKIFKNNEIKILHEIVKFDIINDITNKFN